jgi:drug/metabolite transporter (DMT)-like permease
LQVLPNLPADVALLVLLAAVLHASWNAIAKSGGSKLLDITTMTVAAGAICAAALPFLLRPAAPGMPGKGTLFALGNSAIIASYTLVDGQGMRLSASPVAYSLWLYVLNAFPLAALAVMRHGGGVWRHMRQRWAPGAIGGFLTIASYTIVLWAMTRAPIAAVAALRETSVIFAALIGSVLLKEQMGRPRVAGAIVVACGIAALIL